MAWEGITEWILCKLLLLRMDSGLSILIVEDMENTGSDLVVDNCFDLFAHNIGTKLLIEGGCCM